MERPVLTEGVYELTTAEGRKPFDVVLGDGVVGVSRFRSGGPWEVIPLSRFFPLHPAYFARYDKHLPPVLPARQTCWVRDGSRMVPQDDLDYSLALLSEHRKMAHAGDRCHRCGKKIEGMKCVKPGCWYVWCEECW